MVGLELHVAHLDFLIVMCAREVMHQHLGLSVERRYHDLKKGQCRFCLWPEACVFLLAVGCCKLYRRPPRSYAPTYTRRGAPTCTRSRKLHKAGEIEARSLRSLKRGVGEGEVGNVVARFKRSGCSELGVLRR